MTFSEPSYCIIPNKGVKEMSMNSDRGQDVPRVVLSPGGSHCSLTRDRLRQSQFWKAKVCENDIMLSLGSVRRCPILRNWKLTLKEGIILASIAWDCMYEANVFTLGSQNSAVNLKNGSVL